MSEPRLRLHDGSVDTSPELRAEVSELQTVLRHYWPELVADGLFGRGTERAVRAFQRACGLPTDGVVGPATWQALLEPSAPVEDRFATSYPLDHPELLGDLEASARYGAMISDAAAASGLQPAVIVALGSRATGFGRRLTPPGAGGTCDFTPRPEPLPHRPGPLPADGRGFRRGLLGIDWDGHAFAREGRWHDPRANLLYGCQVVSEARRHLRRRSLLSATALLRAALAAYDCGAGNVVRALRHGHDLDFYTSGRDYSRDILERAGFFQAHGWD
jgi:hypothetical protein